MERNKCFLVVFFLFFQSFILKGQELRTYLIYFTDKDNSPFSIEQPEEFLSQRSIMRRERQYIPFTVQDLPVNPNYIDSLIEKGVDVVFTSRWFNAAIVHASNAQLESIYQISIVNNIHQVARKKLMYDAEENANNIKSESIELAVEGTNIENLYGNSWNQNNMLNIPQMHADGYKGDGILIGVLDAGFRNVNQISCFQHLFDNNKILATYDFVDREESVYEDNGHGTNVLSILAGYQENQLISPAYEAEYLLLRTEDASTEYQIEETNWLVAAEYADSAGVDIINTSLGYTTFDDPAMNYSYNDLDGNTTIISRAADIAVSKGILVITSAGNEGNKPWKYITAPADGHSALAIGAVDYMKNHASFSSVGPSVDGRIKPDLAAQGLGVIFCNSSGTMSSGSGTSYSAPLVTGLAAGIWQSCRDLTVNELSEYLVNSGSKSQNPDNFLGYGIPDYYKIKNEILNSKSGYLYFEVHPNPFSGNILKLKLYSPDVRDRDFSIDVFDTSGRVVDKFIFSANFNDELIELNVSSWLPGIYLLKIKAYSQSQMLKIIKAGN